MRSLLEERILKSIISEYLHEVDLGNISEDLFIDFIIDYTDTIANEKAIELLNELTARTNED